MEKEVDERVHFTQSLAAVSQIEKLAQKKGKNSVNERFKVHPDTCYPHAYLNRNELRQEMNMKSVNYHDLRRNNSPKNFHQVQHDNEIGQLWVEVLQCFGLPTVSAFREVSAYAIAVCGSNAFKTDVMPPVANPMWLCKMQRAAIFPLSKAYQKLFVGIFDNGAAEPYYEFIGRVVVDLSRIRPECVYDVTLPLRQSAHVFSREPRGAVRLRLHLHWDSERAAVLSYLPTQYPKFSPNEAHQIHCLDEKGFRNVAHVVHGRDMPGKFSLTLLKGTVREIDFMRIHYSRYLRKRELYNLRYWVYPFISGFVFLAWMHAVYANTVRYVPAHFVTFLLLHMSKNYVRYGMNRGEGFLPPSMEELLLALLYGREGNPQRYIEPLNMERDEHFQKKISHHYDESGDDEYEELLSEADGIPMNRIAEHMRQAMQVRDYKSWIRTYRDCFSGTEAVDFLISFGYARSREEAVVLGKRLATETKLFEHISQKFEFEDLPHHYQFLEYDSRSYVITGRRPRGERFFRLIGFLKGERETNFVHHMEFPFATEKDHPRFSVEQSIVIRSGGAKKEHEQRERKRRDSMESEGFAFEPVDEGGDKNGRHPPDPATAYSFDSLFRPISPPTTPLPVSRGRTESEDRWKQRLQVAPDLKRASTEAVKGVKTGVKTGLKRAQNLLTNESDEDKARAMDNNLSLLSVFDTYHADGNNGYVVDVKNRTTENFVIQESTLVEPPPQDVNVTSPSSQGSSFTKTVSDARYEMHKTFGHAFNDSVFKIDKTLYPTTTEQIDDVGSRNNSKEFTITKHTAGQKTPYQMRMDENNRILQIEKYSHSSQWISRIGGIIQPMVETLHVGLYLGRALFNIFTWQDPILSFWICVFGSILVVLLYLAPFRFFFAIAGVGLVGPQNWALRVYQEQQPGYQPPNFNKTIKRKRLNQWTRKHQSDGLIFSSTAPGGNIHGYTNPKDVRSVVVPCSVLKYNRFYEWPPEAEYARVYEASVEDMMDLQRIGQSNGALTTVDESDESSSILSTTDRIEASRPTTSPARNVRSPKRFRKRIGELRERRKERNFRKRIGEIRQKRKEKKERKKKRRHDSPEAMIDPFEDDIYRSSKKKGA